MRDRAHALLALKRPVEALEHLRTALAADPNNPDLYCLAAQANLELQDYPEALSLADRAVTCGPEEEWAFRLRAIALTHLVQPEEAVAAAREAVRLEPWLSATHMTLARALDVADDHAGALAAARYAVELDPDDANTHVTLGDVLSGHYDALLQAISAYETALAIDPENTAALNNVAVARLMVHENDRNAAGEFERALRLDPTDTTARENLLNTGDARDVNECRRMSLLMTLPALVILIYNPVFAVAWLAIPILLEITRLILVSRLSPPVRQMLRDERRARRLSPREWALGHRRDE